MFFSGRQVLAAVFGLCCVWEGHASAEAPSLQNGKAVKMELSEPTIVQKELLPVSFGTQVSSPNDNGQHAGGIVDKELEIQKFGEGGGPGLSAVTSRANEEEESGNSIIAKTGMSLKPFGEEVVESSELGGVSAQSLFQASESLPVEAISTPPKSLATSVLREVSKHPVLMVMTFNPWANLLRLLLNQLSTIAEGEPTAASIPQTDSSEASWGFDVSAVRKVQAVVLLAVGGMLLLATYISHVRQAAVQAKFIGQEDVDSLSYIYKARQLDEQRRLERDRRTSTATVLMV